MVDVGNTGRTVNVMQAGYLFPLSHQAVEKPSFGCKAGGLVRTNQPVPRMRAQSASESFDRRLGSKPHHLHKHSPTSARPRSTLNVDVFCGSNAIAILFPFR